MIYSVIIQPSAFEEIENAYSWICDNLSPEIANDWYYELQDAISSLQQFPNRCSIAPETVKVSREIRQLWVGKRKKYRILFVVEGDIVAILHVRHSRQKNLE